MSDLFGVMIVGIIFCSIYKLFELFVRKRERLLLIERLGDKIHLDSLKGDFRFDVNSDSFFSLRLCCLLIGLGVGLLMGFLLTYVLMRSYYETDESRYMLRGSVSLCIASCLLIGGGLGLLISYLVERSERNNRLPSGSCGSNLSERPTRSSQPLPTDE